jgi:hypothetical protein
MAGPVPRIVIPRPHEYRRWRFEYWHARTHAYGRREAFARAARVLRAARERGSRVGSPFAG